MIMIIIGKSFYNGKLEGSVYVYWFFFVLVWNGVLSEIFFEIFDCCLGD